MGRSAGEGISYPLQYSWVSLVARETNETCSAEGSGWDQVSMSLAGVGEAGHVHHLGVKEPVSLRSSPWFPMGPHGWSQVTGKPEAQCLRCSNLHTQDPGRSQSA